MPSTRYDADAGIRRRPHRWRARPHGRRSTPPGCASASWSRASTTSSPRACSRARSTALRAPRCARGRHRGGLGARRVRDSHRGPGAGRARRRRRGGLPRCGDSRRHPALRLRRGRGGARDRVGACDHRASRRPSACSPSTPSSRRSTAPAASTATRAPRPPIAAVEMVSLLRDLRSAGHGRASRRLMSRAGARRLAAAERDRDPLRDRRGRSRGRRSRTSATTPRRRARLPAVTSSVLVTDGAAPGDIDRHIHAARHAGSSIYRLDEAALARLEPDLIVTQELCDVCAVAYSEVRRAVRRLPGDVPVLSLEPRSLDEICASVEEVGVATGRVDGAAASAAAMRERIAEIASLGRHPTRARASSASNGPIRSWSVATGCPRWSASRAASTSSARRASRRATSRGTRSSRRDPDVMVLMPCGYDLAQDRRAGAGGRVTSRVRRPRLRAQRPGARSRRIRVLQPPRTADRRRARDPRRGAARRPGDPPPAGAAYWNQPATSRIALIVARRRCRGSRRRGRPPVCAIPTIARLAITSSGDRVEIGRGGLVLRRSDRVRETSTVSRRPR